jgi:hypothetical protein
MTAAMTTWLHGALMPLWSHENTILDDDVAYKIRVTMSSKIWQWRRGDGGAAAGAFDSSRPASRSRSLHVAKACFA